MRLIMKIVAALAAFAGACNAALGGVPQIELPSTSVMHDEAIDITVTGLEPWQRVRLRLTSELRGVPFASEADFYADVQGVVGVADQAPVAGDYMSIDPMGLFWSMRSKALSGDHEAPPKSDPWELPRPQRYQLAVLIDDRQVATSSLERVLVPEGVQARRLDEGRLRGVLFLPPGEGPHPAMLVVSGSEGGYPTRSAIALAGRGYAALALAYFNAPDLPEKLAEIPLEYFSEGLQWLASQPEIDGGRIGVMGGSRGGELALLLGATFSQVRAVVAIGPSHVMWGGCCDDDAGKRPSWTLGGKPLRFIPETGDVKRLAAYWKLVGESYLAYVWLHLADPAEELAAAIPVEQIRGPVLLISGGDDQMWPSSYMADQVMKRLEAHAFGHRHFHLRYDDAGHAAGSRPYWPTPSQVRVRHPVTGEEFNLGGKPEALAHSHEDSWRRTLEFLRASLQ